MEQSDFDGVPDGELVERIRAGEKTLYEIVMRRYNQRLYRVSRAIVRDEQEAEDIVQETYTRAYFKLDQFAGAAKFSTWLTKIAINEGLARVRKRGRERPGPSENLGCSRADPEQQTLRREAQAMIEAAVDALPGNLRPVFMLRDIEEMNTAETAECLGLTVETVKIRLHRARKLLRNDLHGLLGETSPHAFGFLGKRCDAMIDAVKNRIDASAIGSLRDGA
jgi:RNA polymerase sigma-70 factor (ECF subfamily)